MEIMAYESNGALADKSAIFCMSLHSRLLFNFRRGAFPTPNDSRSLHSQKRIGFTFWIVGYFLWVTRISPIRINILCRNLIQRCKISLCIVLFFSKIFNGLEVFGNIRKNAIFYVYAFYFEWCNSAKFSSLLIKFDM